LIAAHPLGQAVYNGTKAFVDSFAAALRNEMKDSGVTLTCLMPGATDTEFFAHADMLDTKVGTEEKMDPAEVARIDQVGDREGEVPHNARVPWDDGASDYAKVRDVIAAAFQTSFPRLQRPPQVAGGVYRPMAPNQGQ
jgi:short-subunit dehydrogenase